MEPLSSEPAVRALWAIGEPGRAATEMSPGPPGALIGHADFEASSASLPGVQVRAATSRGLMHRAAREPRQDAFALGRRADDTLIAVVCDGVGSLGRSHEAADLAARVLATAGAADVRWADAFQDANEQLHAVMADVNGDSASRMATTAIALAVRRQGNAWVGELGVVGDSSCWHLAADGTWSHVAGSPPESDAETYHSGRVAPLPSGDGACEALSFTVEGGALFLFTDGVANPIKWSDQVQEALAEWWTAPVDPLVFASQVGFARKTHMDDRTAVGIWPHDEESTA
jgi:hypothetical protein